MEDVFSDLRVEVRELMETVDALAAEVRITMTRTGTFMTPNGPIPATGRRLVLEACDCTRWREARVVSFHSHLDQLALLAPLELLPAPESVQAP